MSRKISTEEARGLAWRWRESLMPPGSRMSRLHLSAAGREQLFAWVRARMDASPAVSKMGRCYAVKYELGLTEREVWALCEAAGWRA